MAPADGRTDPLFSAGVPSVTVVILAFKRLDKLRETLRHTLEDLNYPAEALEVIVVDNASANGTAEMVGAEFPGVRVIVLAENVGASGWNAGLHAGSGRWTLMLDDAVIWPETTCAAPWSPPRPIGPTSSRSARAAAMTHPSSSTLTIPRAS
jgi:hypothetical protein